MQLHNHYSYGQLFAFSGLDGETHTLNDLAGMIMEGPITIRFQAELVTTLSIPLQGDVSFKLVSGDVIDFTANGREGKVVFMDAYTVSGIVPVEPKLITTDGYVVKRKKGFRKQTLCQHNVPQTEEEFRFDEKYVLSVKKDGEDYIFHLHFFGKQNIPMKKYTRAQIDETCARNYRYYENLPACKDERFEPLYYKCLSVNKENV